MTKDAINLLYDKPVDRIAALLLRRAPSWARFPNFEKDALDKSPPRIKPEDVCNVFKEPPVRPHQHHQIQNHCGERHGDYLIIGYAHDNVGSGFINKSPSTNKCKPWWYVGDDWNSRRFGVSKGRRIEHVWWIMDRNGEVQSLEWGYIKKLLPGETVDEMHERRNGKLYPMPKSQFSHKKRPSKSANSASR